MRDHSHIWTEGSDVCAHCGQPLPAASPNPTWGKRRASRTGIIVTILLHLLLVAIYLLQPNRVNKSARPSRETEMVYVSPLAGPPRPKAQQQAARKTKSTPRKPEVVHVQRLPDTITLPDEKPVEEVKETPKKMTPVPPEMDMQAYIEARRKARGAPTPQPAEESDEARGMRNALANIAAANGRSRDDRNETGGVFSISNKTFHSAELKFRGWNPNFKRRWLTDVTVERGNYPDIETAVVMKMIELIRKEKTGDFEWESHRLGRVVTMSARPEDTEQLKAFLFKEMFEDYKAPGH